MKKWRPAVVLVLGYLSSIVDPHITSVVAHWALANPDIASTLLTIVIALYHGLESPVKKKAELPSAK